jgi:DNA-directed RNA polymerase subunit RPC12/RpoP
MAEGCTSADRHDAMMEPARRLVSMNLACAWCSRRLQLHDADLLNRDGDVACPGCHRSIFCWAG